MLYSLVDYYTPNSLSGAARSNFLFATFAHEWRVEELTAVQLISLSHLQDHVVHTYAYLHVYQQGVFLPVARPVPSAHQERHPARPHTTTSTLTVSSACCITFAAKDRQIVR